MYSSEDLERFYFHANFSEEFKLSGAEATGGETGGLMLSVIGINYCALTIQRNYMFHFGSDEGAEMATTYQSIFSTVKLQGRSAWEYLGKFFTKSLVKRRALSLLEHLSVKTLSKIFKGCRDFVSLRPNKFSCQRVQNQTCLSYAECSRKS